MPLPQGLRSRYLTLNEAASRLSLSIGDLMCAAENGKLTLVIQSHARWVVRFCPVGFSDQYPEEPWNYADCLPVPSYAIATLNATEKANFSRFPWPGLSQQWFEIALLPKMESGCEIRFTQEDLRITAEELERIKNGKEIEPFDFVSAPTNEVGWQNMLITVSDDLHREFIEQTSMEVVPVKSQTASSNGTWQERVRAIADELHAKDTAAGAYSSKTDISSRAAKLAGERGIEGPHGKLSAANILREALQGERWKRKDPAK